MADFRPTEQPSLIRTTCGTCGVIEVPLHHVVLRVDEESAMGVCVVRCPQCAQRCTRPACDVMMTALVAVGVQISLTVTERSQATDENLTPSEIEAFVAALDQHSDLVAVLHSEEPPATAD